MPIPADFIAHGKLLAAGSTFFGVPTEELSREELLAAFGWATDQLAAVNKSFQFSYMLSETATDELIRGLRGQAPLAP